MARGLPLRRGVRRLVCVALLVAMALPGPGSSMRARPIAVAAANQSFNWSGYVQGALGKGHTFHSVAATWVVPTATPHRPGGAEYSSSWIGIGGGCLDTSCTATDATLIQAGVGHDITAAGTADYYAWWETIPAPLVRTALAVRPGDRVAVGIFERSVPELWTIAIVNVTTRDAFTLTLPYASTYGSAEWVIETPVVIADDGTVSVGPMPDLSIVRFDYARAPSFVATERIELVDFDLNVIATPSVPDAQGDGFNDCTYRSSCPAP
jgi:hypothetical protein